MTVRTLRRTLAATALAAVPLAAATACDKSDPPPRTQTPAANAPAPAGPSSGAGGSGSSSPAPTAQSLSGQSALGSAVRRGEKLKSATVMKELLMTQILAKQETGKWPAKFPDDAKLANPWTESDPGYEWAPPPPGTRDDGATVVLYQLKDGKRVTGAPTGRADGSVREPNE